MRRLVVLAVLLVACAAPREATRTASDASQPSAPGIATRSLVIALSAEPASLDQNLNAGSNNSDFGALANGYLVYHEPPQMPKPYLAAEVPSLGTDSWRVFP